MKLGLLEKGVAVIIIVTKDNMTPMTMTTMMSTTVTERSEIAAGIMTQIARMTPWTEKEAQVVDKDMTRTQTAVTRWNTDIDLGDMNPNPKKNSTTVAKNEKQKCPPATQPDFNRQKSLPLPKRAFVAVKRKNYQITIVNMEFMGTERLSIEMPSRAKNV